MTENNKSWGLGVITGVVMTSLIAISLNKISHKPPMPPLVDVIPADIITAYNQGLRDALRTNPVSMDLEMTCLELWGRKL